MKRLEARLRQQRRNEAQPVPVFIEFDSLNMTAAEAIQEAVRSGHVPQYAVLVVLPQHIQDRETWKNHCQAELVERERRRAAEKQQSTQAGTDPAEHS